MHPIDPACPSEDDYRLHTSPPGSAPTNASCSSRTTTACTVWGRVGYSARRHQRRGHRRRLRRLPQRPCHWSDRCSGAVRNSPLHLSGTVRDDFAHSRCRRAWNTAAGTPRRTSTKYRAQPWPTPLCRVNEWCCLIDPGPGSSGHGPPGTGPLAWTVCLGNYIQDNGRECGFHDVLNWGRSVGRRCLPVHVPHPGRRARLAFNPERSIGTRRRAPGSSQRREHGLILRPRPSLPATGPGVGRPPSRNSKFLKELKQLQVLLQVQRSGGISPARSPGAARLKPTAQVRVPPAG